MVDFLNELVIGEHAVGTRVTDNTYKGFNSVGTLVGVRRTDWHCICKMVHVYNRSICSRVAEQG